MEKKPGERIKLIVSDLTENQSCTGQSKQFHLASDKLGIQLKRQAGKEIQALSASFFFFFKAVT